MKGQQMDKGEIFKREFRIIPGEEGSFTVTRPYSDGPGSPGLSWGFSSIDDLMRWLVDNSLAFERSNVTEEGCGFND